MRRKIHRVTKPRRKKKPPLNSSQQFETLLKNNADVKRFSFRLYITGTTPRSTQALSNVRALCEQYLPGRYDLTVVDIYQQPDEAAAEQIIAAPTLVKKLPVPMRRFIGDLADRDKVLLALNLIRS